MSQANLTGHDEMPPMSQQEPLAAFVVAMVKAGDWDHPVVVNVMRVNGYSKERLVELCGIKENT